MDEETTFSVLQTDPVMPSEAQLVAAFGCIDSLTDYDAKRRAKGTAGYIADHLSYEDAMGLMGGLAQQGLAAAIEEDDAIPQLPQPFKTRRANCTDAGVELLDSLNRPVTVPWDAVRLVACGAVMRTRNTSTGAGLSGQPQDLGLNTGAIMAGGVSGFYVASSISMPSFEIGSNEVRQCEPTLEIHTIGNPERWVLEGSFSVQLNGESIRPRDEAVHQAACICAERATAAIVNFGIQEAAENHRLLAYHHRSFFERELRWLNWLMTL